MAMNFLKQNILLPILTSRNQMLLLAAGLIVHPGLSFTHNFVVESRVQDPTFCAMSEGNLDTTMKLLVVNTRPKYDHQKIEEVDLV